jgi:UDP:flavonoid glycosyltransferase YjiC (YdhE family)
MRVLFTTQPAYGHLHPVVPLAQAMVAAGDDVRIASSASFQPRISAAGVEGTVAGIDWLESDIEGGFPEFAEHRQRGESKRYLQSEVFAWLTAQATAADVVRLARQWPVDLIVREPWELGGAAAAAELGVPCVVHGIGSRANVDELVDLAGDRLRQLGTGVGLAEDLGWIGGAVYLDPCPPCLQPAGQSCVTGRIQPLRPEPFDATDGAPEGPAWLAELGARSVVYVGLGTVMNRWGDLLERIVDDVQDLDADIVVTTGPGRDPADFRGRPPNVHVEGYVPLTVLLPACDVVVCHAGWSTTIAALSSGLPLVTIPIGADGPRTAARCEDAGLGRTVAPDHVRAGVVSALVRSLLDDGRYAAAARDAQRQIQQLPAPADLVKDLHALAS